MKKRRIENPWMLGVILLIVALVGSYAYEGIEGVLWVLLGLVLGLVVGFGIPYLIQRRSGR